MGSRFIAFDLASYGYSGFDPSFSRASQEEAFRKLNQGVLENTNPSTAQQELINGWYGGVGGVDTTGKTVTDTFVPTGWVGHETLYTDVVRTSCRTCHVNRDPTIDWNKFSGGLVDVFGTWIGQGQVNDTPTGVINQKPPPFQGGQGFDVFVCSYGQDQGLRPDPNFPVNNYWATSLIFLLDSSGNIQNPQTLTAGA